MRVCAAVRTLNSRRFRFDDLGLWSGSDYDFSSPLELFSDVGNLSTGGVMPNNAERNREMLAAYEAGRTIEQLSKDYGLSAITIGSVLTGERHKREVSPDPFYRSLRQY